jgi:RND superfamily putative drug exporter
MGLMAGLTVAVMVALALTLLPAMLGFAGHRIDAIRLPGDAGRRRRSPGRESLWHAGAARWRRTRGATSSAARSAWPCWPRRASPCGWA